MKSVIVCLLLLLMNIPFGEGGQSEDNPPIFSVKKLQLIKHEVTTKAKDYVDREASRVVIYELDNGEEYLMRVDPPEHCTRFVICSIDRARADPQGPTKSCEEASESILVYPHGEHEGEIYKRDKSGSTPTVKKETKHKLLDDNIKIKIVGTNLEFHFKEISIDRNKERDEVVPLTVTLTVSSMRGLRVETSSFYCNVHVGTIKSTKDEEPKMFPLAKSATNYELDVDPIDYGKARPTTAVELRKCFGPIFLKPGNKKDLCQPMANLDLYTVNHKAQCPFVHDWIGFAKWSGPPLEKGFINNFWKGPVYDYQLGKPTGSTGSNCGKSRKEMFMIDFEIDNVFNPQKEMKDGHSCFGFALAFDTHKVSTTPEDKPKLTLDPKKTFEFYPPAMMFLAPDSEKIRELRVSRQGLRKIRISFLDNSADANALDMAMVEYGFLNENIAGVREYVNLPAKSVQGFDFVTLFQEGFCNIRVLNVNHHALTPEKRCWTITGCDVLEKL